LGSLTGLAVFASLTVADPHHPTLTGTVAQVVALSIPLVVNLLGVRHWVRAMAGSGAIDLEELARRLDADGAWWSEVVPGPLSLQRQRMAPAGLEDLIRRSAEATTPDLVVQTLSDRPQPRRNIESRSAIIVPKPHLGQVAVLVRRSVRPLTPADLEQAVTLLHAPSADGPINGHRAHSGEAVSVLGSRALQASAIARVTALIRWSSPAVAFGLVGLSGIGVNQALLAGIVGLLHINYLIAAVLASVGSTTSNFILTERWVFRAHRRSGVLRRLLSYMVLTLVSTPVRLPILYVLTSLYGVHYLVSNLVAILTIFGGRYLISALVIWRQVTPSVEVQVTE
jgi:putative flippase GtrA